MAGWIPDDTLEKIRNASDIVEIIRSHVPSLKKAGRAFKGLCPFHTEKTPSFNVNPDKQTFYCFGCQKGGDVFGFVRDIENLPFTDAVRRLAERARIPIEEGNAEEEQRARSEKDKLLLIHEKITQRWHQVLLKEPEGGPGRSYLRRRGMSLDSIETFRLGFAPDSWEDTVNWAKEQGYPLDLMETSGLVIHNTDKDRWYDRFRGRLLFPICDDQGRVVGFSGRVLDSTAKAAKYVNSPETPLFKKSRIIFGLDKSKKSIIEKKSAIICEGQADLISCFSAGVTNVVAPQGTALTEQHARILKRYAEEVVLCFDSDAAGQAAAVKSLDPLLDAELSIRVVTVPEPHDPDTFIKEHGGEAFQKLVDEAPEFFAFYLNVLCGEHDEKTDRGKTVIVRAMGIAIKKTNSNTLIETYARITGERLGVPAEAVRLDFQNIKEPITYSRPKPEPRPFQDGSPPPVDVPGGSFDEGGSFDNLPEGSFESGADVGYAEPVYKPPPREVHFLKLILLNEDIVEEILPVMDELWFQDPTIREVLMEVRRLFLGGEWKGSASLVGHQSDANAQSLIAGALAETRELPNPERQARDCLSKLRETWLKAELNRIFHKALAPDLTPERRREIIDRQQELKAFLRIPLFSDDKDEAQPF